MEEMQALGLRGVPVVTKGGRYVLGVELDFAKLDELLGLARNASGRQLRGNELVERAVRLLAAAIRFARQLPPARYDDPFPGMEGARVPFMQGDHVLVAADGKPYVPHATCLGLVRHIVGHGARYRHLIRNQDADYSHFGLFSQLGEPEQSLDVAQLADRAALITADIRAWWQDSLGRDLGRAMRTFAGPETLQQMLQREVYSLTQHTRQLMTILRNLGIEPDGPIGEADYEGLQLPAGVWS